MDRDGVRLFLLSMAAMPLACSGAGLPGGAAPGTPIPVDDDVDGLPGDGDDGARPGINPGGGGCEAWIAAMVTCGGYDDYGDYDYGSGGGAPQGSTGYDEDYGDYPSPQSDAFCPYYLGLLEREYGADCAAATDSLFACLAMFVCQDLDTDTFDNLCASAAAAAEHACRSFDGPDTVPATTGLTTTTDPTDPTDPTVGDACPESGSYTVSGSCGAQFDSCPDGNSYEITCTPPADGAGQHTCICELNGAQTTAFEIDNPCNTIWVQLANTSCGYPTAT